jgi:pSer/pThr/pTyr-binding forkhead associated (FHA) protein/ribosomal protein L40E
MIVCPNCNHSNPDGAIQCEACYTPLPATTTCPKCGAAVQADANFCGQCGFNLLAAPAAVSVATPSTDAPDATVSPSVNAADLVVPDPLVVPDSLFENPLISEPPDLAVPAASPAQELPPAVIPVNETPPPAPPTQFPSPSSPKTQLQQQVAKLLHVQTNTTIELPQNLSVIHIGKQNDRIPPDVDVSGFPDSEIVSRIHADIRVEGDAYYLEDVGSSNGTYVNNMPLSIGNRHRLRTGDRIALGKGDRVTFLFHIS